MVKVDAAPLTPLNSPAITSTTPPLSNWYFPSLSFVIDYENVIRWANKGAKFAKVDNLLGAFRLHEAAKTSNLEEIRKKEHEMVKNNYHEILFANKKPTKFDYIFLRLNAPQRVLSLNKNKKSNYTI